MHMQWLKKGILHAALAAAVALAAGCGGRDDATGTTDPAQASAAASADSSAPGAEASSRSSDPRKDTPQIELTDELLQGYARGLAKEAEIIRRPDRELPSHMGVDVSAKYPTEESTELLAAAGLDAEGYRAVDQVVRPVLTTLSFQGRIEPRLSLDLERASEAQRKQVASDPFDNLSPASAAALRRNFDAIVEPWGQVTRQLAQFD